MHILNENYYDNESPGAFFNASKNMFMKRKEKKNINTRYSLTKNNDNIHKNDIQRDTNFGYLVLYGYLDNCIWLAIWYVKSTVNLVTATVNFIYKNDDQICIWFT